MKNIQLLEKLHSKQFKLKEFSNNTTIFEEGEKAYGVYFLKAGNVKVFKNNLKGKPIFLWTAEIGEPFGVVSYFMKSKNYTCSLIAEKKISTLIYVPYKEFSLLLSKYPEFKSGLLSNLCEQINHMELRSKTVLFSKTNERIINTLLFFAAKREQAKKRLHLEFSLTDLAEMVGASKNYTRKKIRILKNENLIDYGNNWFEINDIERLKRAKELL